MTVSRPLYEHVISLGYFCSTALELQRYGLRDGSYPFDWNISFLEPTLTLIRSDFEGFLVRDRLVRDPTRPGIVHDTGSGIDVYNDFAPDLSIDDQFAEVSAKYARRIERFRRATRQRTLFVRYIVNLEEHAYLDEHMAEVMAILRKSNPLNDLVLVGTDDLPSACGGLRVFTASVDEDDDVARAFLRKNRELRRLMLGLPYPTSRRLLNLYTFWLARTTSKIRATLSRMGVGRLLRRLRIEEVEASLSCVRLRTPGRSPPRTPAGSARPSARP